MLRFRQWLRREALTLILAAAFVAAGLNLVLTPHGLRGLLVLRHYGEHLEAQRETAQAENRELQQTVAKLQSDDSYIQRVIRKELGFARSNELIYRFANESQNSAPAAP